MYKKRRKEKCLWKLEKITAVMRVQMMVVDSVESQMMIMLRKLFAKQANHQEVNMKTDFAMESWS